MYLLIVTGLSGSGKSSALKILEDNGFYCVDNLPSVMLTEFVTLCRETNPDIKMTAVAIDAREYNLRHSPRLDLDALSQLNIDYEILFLDCKDEVISQRYNETRRQHPMSKRIPLGVAFERDYLMNLRDRANYILDTSQLKANELRERIMSTIKHKNPQEFSLVLQSFGYKHGVPFETDMVYDMRFVRNPYYEESLRELSGLDAPIADYINEDSSVQKFMDSVEEQIRFLIPRFLEQNKPRLMVSFGCTGGRHRSVYGANLMYEKLKGDFSTSVIHRDLKVWKD